MENYLREITQDNLSKAIRKAKKVKPLVRLTGSKNVFLVRKSDGKDFYTVIISLSQDKQKVIGSCECDGYKFGEFCKHLAACTEFSIYCQSNVVYMSERQTKSFRGECPYCHEQIDMNNECLCPSEKVRIA